MTQVGVPVAQAAGTICRTTSPIETHLPFPQECSIIVMTLGEARAVCGADSGGLQRPFHNLTPVPATAGLCHPTVTYAVRP